jgi:hypothetical protein
MRRSNLGKRERAAGKRHRRARYISGAMTDWLKVGSKHSRRSIRRVFTVADAETLATGAKEISRQHHGCRSTQVGENPQEPQC